MRAFAAAMFAMLLCACAAKENPPAALADHTGRWVVINYWAQWCNPCIEEIPELNALDAAHPDVAVLGVNYDGASGEELRAQEQRLGVAFPTLAEDPAAVLGIPRPAVLPTTLVLDPRGQLVDTLVGPQTSASLEAALRRAGRA